MLIKEVSFNNFYQPDILVILLHCLYQLTVKYKLQA